VRGAGYNMWIKKDLNAYRTNSESLRKFAETYFKEELDEIRENYWIIVTSVNLDYTDGYVTLYIEYGAGGVVMKTQLTKKTSSLDGLNDFIFEV
jgi:hypothetical protein